MKKITWVIIITILLFAIVISEQIFVDNCLNTLDAKIDTIYTTVLAQENVDAENVIKLNDDIDVFWTENEKILCLFINHNDLNKVGEEIKRMKVFASQNNKEDFLNELEVLKFYVQSYRHVMEINIQNLL